MGRGNQVSSIFWLILGLGVVYASYRLGLGTLTHPGPGFLSFWCGIILSVLSALVFIQGGIARRQGNQTKLRQLWMEAKWSKCIFLVLAMLVYVLTFSYLGFLLSTILLLIFLFKAIEPQKWFVAMGGAILASLISFIVFALWLDVQLPRGFIERLIF